MFKNISLVCLLVTVFFHFNAISAEIFCKDYLEPNTGQSFENPVLDLRELSDLDKQMLLSQLKQGVVGQTDRTNQSSKKLSAEQEMIIKNLLDGFKEIGVSADVALGVIEAFNDLNVIYKLIRNPRNTFVANPNSLLSPFASQNKPEVDLDKLMANVDNINTQDSWTSLGSRVSLLIRFLKWIQASDDRRTKELGYELAHNIDYILQDGLHDEISYDRAMDLLGDTFEITERAYFVIANGRNELWKIEQLLANSNGQVLVKAQKKRIARLKRKIFWAQVRLGRYFGRYKTARIYLENLAATENAKCGQSCKTLIQRILNGLGITTSDKLKDPDLYIGRAPNMDDIDFAFNSNRAAMASYLTTSIFLQLTDNLRTSFYTLLNTSPLLKAINLIPYPAIRKPLKSVLSFGVYIRAKRGHFQTLHNIVGAESLEVQFDLLIKAHNERPGIMETASRLRHFPWDILKNHAKEKANGDTNQGQYTEFLKQMEVAEVQGREYGFITFDAKTPLLQMLTLLGAAEGISYYFMGVHLGPLLWDGLKESLDFVSSNVTVKEAAIGAGALAATAGSVSPIKKGITSIKKKLGKAKDQED